MNFSQNQGVLKIFFLKKGRGVLGILAISVYD
jgi:hypothetical protein